VTLEKKHLVLREKLVSDAPCLYQLNTDSEELRHTEDVPVKPVLDVQNFSRTTPILKK
jgi:hypothetical protein